MELMSPNLQNRNAPSKNCTVSGCGGMMMFRGGQGLSSGSDALEGSPESAWVCDTNPDHVEGVTPAEEQAISGS